MKTNGFFGFVAIVWFTILSTTEMTSVNFRDISEAEVENHRKLTNTLLQKLNYNSPPITKGDFQIETEIKNENQRNKRSPMPAIVDRQQQQQQQWRSARGGLERNFLRFGRGGLKSNFLRFGRARDGLDRNFLRFGRAYNDVDVDEQVEHNEEQDAVILDQLMDDLKAAMNDNVCSENFNIVTSTDSENDDDVQDDKKTVAIKRGSLNNNFLRYGRRSLKSHHPSVFNGKRGSLDRNFLRFGKRSDATVDNNDDSNQTLLNKRYPTRRPSAEDTSKSIR